MRKRRKMNGLRRGPLTIKDKVYIDRNKQKGVEHIAKMLKRSEIAIFNYLNPVEEEVEVETEIKEEPKESYLMTNMARQRPGTGVVAMTQNAAMISDSVRENRRKSNIPPQFIMNKDGRNHY